VSQVYTTTDYGITYLFHDHHVRSNMHAYEQHDKLFMLGYTSVE